VSEVVIGTAAGIVTPIITTGSVNRMKLKEGDDVFAVNEGNLGVDRKRIVVRFDV
jgi:molybdopterin-binding protein